MAPQDRYSLTDKDVADERACRQRVELMFDAVKNSLEEYKVQVREGFERQGNAFEEYKQATREDIAELKKDVERLTEVVSSGQTPLTNRVSVLEERITTTNRILGVLGGGVIMSLFTLIGAIVLNVLRIGGK